MHLQQLPLPDSFRHARWRALMGRDICSGAAFVCFLRNFGKNLVARNLQCLSVCAILNTETHHTLHIHEIFRLPQCFLLGITVIG